MKTTMSKWAMKAAGAGAVAILLATPSFAQSRGDRNRDSGNFDRRRQTSQDRSDGRNQNDSRRGNTGNRENDRITMAGRISSVTHERDGYRVQFDRDNRSYWVPQSTFGRHSRDLRAGISISLGGVYRGGRIYVDALNSPDGIGAYGYDSGYVRGVVDRVDYRSGTILVRDEASGSLITAAIDGGGYGQSDLRNLRPGDYVEISGGWARGGVFEASRVDVLRGGRY